MLSSLHFIPPSFLDASVALFCTHSMMMMRPPPLAVSLERSASCRAKLKFQYSLEEREDVYRDYAAAPHCLLGFAGFY